jgi:hypothetical protein
VATASRGLNSFSTREQSPLIPSDELPESYFDPSYDAEAAEAEERAKAREALDAPDERPEHGERLLRRIISDPSESVSVRQDARRLLEVFDLRPRDFPSELNDFLQWRSENRK